MTEGEIKVRTRIILCIILSVAILVYIYQKINNNENSSIDTKEVATVSNPIISPSGEYQLVIKEEIFEGVKCNKFEVFKVVEGYPGTSAIFSSKELFRTRDTLYFIWGDNDRIWVYSGDVGIFFWERVTDEKWKKYVYDEDKNIPVPALLKKLKPEFFDNN